MGADIGDRSRIDAQSLKRFEAKSGSLRLIQNSEYGHHILILGLRDEFGKNANIIKRALRIGISHWAVQKVDGANFAGMVPTVLTTWDSVKVKVDPESILASPFNGFQEISDQGVKGR